MVMAKMMIDISDKAIDTATREEIKGLERQIRNLKLSNGRLKTQLKAQMKKIETAEKVVSYAVEIAGELKNLRDYE